MLSKPASQSYKIGRHLRATSLIMALALGCAAAAHAQVVPTPAPAEKPIPQNVAYYIDGQKADKDGLGKINPQDISNINVIKGTEQQQIFGTASADGTIVVTTKTNVGSPAVLALNKRIEAVKPMVGATPDQTTGVAAAQAYLAKKYPAAKVQMVGPAKDKPGRYHAIFVQDGKRLQLFFDGQGNPVQE